MRRVREERWRVSLIAEVFGDPLQRDLVIALLRASPLTDLFEPLRLDPPLELRANARWLQSPEVARAVLDRWLGLGLGQVAGPVMTALLQIYLARDAEAPTVKLLTRFACHLHLCRLLERSGGGPLTELQALAAAQPAVRDFVGLFAAAQRLGLGRPDDVDVTSRLSKQIDAYAASCATLCGSARVTELEALLARAAKLVSRERREDVA
jgi:hypothetical protein